MLNVIKNNFWKIFVQVILNTAYLFLILYLENSKIMYIIFAASLLLQIIGILTIFSLACIKGSLINVTNNKTLVVNPKDIRK